MVSWESDLNRSMNSDMWSAGLEWSDKFNSQIREVNLETKMEGKGDLSFLWYKIRIENRK